MRIVLIVTGVLISVGLAGGVRWHQGAAALDRGLAAFDRGELDEAADAFAAAAANAMSAERGGLNRALTRLRQGLAADAAEWLGRSASRGVDVTVVRDAHYNRGIALTASGELRNALLAFADALRLDPTHDDARVNYTIVRARLDRATPPPPPSGPTAEALSQRLRLVPDQAYDFTPGRRRRLPGGEDDW